MLHRKIKNIQTLAIFLGSTLAAMGGLVNFLYYEVYLPDTPLESMPVNVFTRIVIDFGLLVSTVGFASLVMSRNLKEIMSK